MIYNKLFIMALCLGLTACSGKFPGTSMPASKAPNTTSLANMSEDFLYLAAQDAIRQNQQELAIQFLDALVKKSPEEQIPRMQLAELLLRTNRAEKAIVHIDAVLGKSLPSSITNKKEAAPFILRARAQAMTGQAEQALKTLSALLSKQPDLLNARLLHVSLLVSMKRVNEAFQSIAAGLHSHESAALRKAQADLLIRQNRLTDAVKVLEIMQKLNWNNEAPSLMLSQLALRQKNKARAEQVLRDYLEKRPAAVRVRAALGRLLVQEKRSQEAITIYKGLIRDTGGTGEMLSELGLVYFQMKDYENASQQFRKALKDSSDDQLRFYLAASLEALNKKEESRQIYTSIGKKSAVYVDAQLRLAGMDMLANNISAAEKRTKAILAEFKNTSDAYMLLSAIYLSQEKYQQLLDETEAGLNLPQVSSRLIFNRAAAYEHLKQYDEVERNLKHLLSMQPQHAEALNFLGYVYAEQGIKLTEAEALIRRALEQSPDDGYYLDSLAWVYFQRGDYEKAINIQKRAMQKVTDDPVMFEHMGDMLWKNGNKTKARNSWEKAIKLNHDKPDLIRKKIADGLHSPASQQR